MNKIFLTTYQRGLLMNYKKMLLSVTALVSLSLFAISVSAAGPVTQYGSLSANGNKVVGEKSGGAAVQLKGVSMQWSVSNWGSDKFFIKEAVDAMVDGWDAQIIRAPLAIDFKNKDGEVTGGYITKPTENWERVKTVVDAAIERDVYAIVDWHAHNAEETDVQAKAIEFFTSKSLAGQYGNNPAVIFEIYNEPVYITWDKVKTYSTAVIKAIRDAGFNNLILIGSPYWDLQTEIAAKDPPTDSKNNLAFVFHFYADVHKTDRNIWRGDGITQKNGRAIVQEALDAGKPVFVSEWGTNDAQTKGKPNLAESDKWHAFLNTNKISSCAWAVSGNGYNELDFWTGTGTPLKSGNISDVANWTNPDKMTPHGRYVYRLLTDKDTTNSSVPPQPPIAGPKTPIPLTSAGPYSNEKNGSTASLVVESGTAHFTYALVKGDYEWDPYAGFAMNFDISKFSGCEYGISYTYKGSAHAIRAQQDDVTDYGYHEKSNANVNDWTEVTVPWSGFKQPWGEPVEQNPAMVDALSWHIEAKDGTAGELFVKDVYCLSGSSVSLKPDRRATYGKNAASFVMMSGNALKVRMAQNGQVDIFNPKGGKVKTIKLRQGDHTIKLNGLPKGTYFVRTKSDVLSRSIEIVVK
jgi:endoglucanase